MSGESHRGPRVWGGSSQAISSLWVLFFINWSACWLVEEELIREVRMAVVGRFVGECR